MDTTSSNKGKGAMNAISSGNQCYMVPPNASGYGEPLDVAPLEPVDHTTSRILNHKAYKGRWKVLRYPRPDGRVDKVVFARCCHIFFSRYSNEKVLISLLYELFSCALYLFVQCFSYMIA